MLQGSPPRRAGGGYDAPADKKASSIVVDFITPETETSIHYFWGMARHFKPRDPSLTTQIREGQGPGTAAGPGQGSPV